VISKDVKYFKEGVVIKRDMEELIPQKKENKNQNHHPIVHQALQIVHQALQINN
jgi:hypothetical protein